MNILRLISTPFTQFSSFVNSLSSRYGKSFIILIGVIYFSQGFRAYSFHSAPLWLFRHDFHLDPSSIQIHTSIILLTWNIKYIYGLIVDCFPINGRHSKPYLYAASLIGFIAFIALGIPALSSTPGSATAWFFASLLSMAFSDVIADGMVVRKGREVFFGNSPLELKSKRSDLALEKGYKRVDGGDLDLEDNEFEDIEDDEEFEEEIEGGAQSLQSYSWGMMYIGKMIGTPLAGTIAGEEGQGIRSLCMYVYSLCAGVIAVVSYYVVEPVDTSIMSLPFSALITRFFTQLKRLIIALLNPRIYKPMLWIFLSSALIPDISVAFEVWKQQELSFGANSQAYITTITDIAGILGTVLYNKYFTNVSFRKIFLRTQLLLSGFMILDYVLVNKWHRALGIPDIIFLIGSGGISKLVAQLNMMPFLTLAAALCPTDIEATFYACLMSISNAGGNVAQLWGSWVLTYQDLVPVKGDEKRIDFTNLSSTVLGVWVMSVLPVLLLGLVPDLSARELELEAVRERKGKTRGRRTDVEGYETERASRSGSRKSRRRRSAGLGIENDNSIDNVELRNM